MRVRLRDHDRVTTGTAEAGLGAFVPRTLRHDGMLYERVSDGPDGTPEFRATEPKAEAPKGNAVVVDASGGDLAVIRIPYPIPDSVVYADVVCPLWTTWDQWARVAYLKPEQT